MNVLLRFGSGSSTSVKPESNIFHGIGSSVVGGVKSTNKHHTPNNNNKEDVLFSVVHNGDDVGDEDEGVYRMGV